MALVRYYGVLNSRLALTRLATTLCPGPKQPLQPTSPN